MNLAAITGLEIDVDTRLLDLWRCLIEDHPDLDEETLDLVAVYARAAYGRGYTDALVEPTRALLFREHGYQVPKRGKR